MVKLIGPCMSLDARGQLGKALIFAKNGKTNYSKSYAVPANPNSRLQQAQRAAIRGITKGWAHVSPTAYPFWAALGQPDQLSAYHAYLKEAIDRVKNSLLPRLTPVPAEVEWVGTVDLAASYADGKWTVTASCDGPFYQPAWVQINECDLCPYNHDRTGLLLLTADIDYDMSSIYSATLEYPATYSTDQTFSARMGLAEGHASPWTDWYIP